MLKKIDFGLIVKIKEIDLQFTNKGLKLIDFGCEDQKYCFTKFGNEMKLNIQGWRLGTYNKFD